MAKITFQEAPLKMKTGVVGIGEHHDNHWGRMLVLKLLQCDGARYLLIESAPDMQGVVDGIVTDNGAINNGMADYLDTRLWQEEGVLRLSVVVYQALRRGVKVRCADHNIVYTESRATTMMGMNKRNEAAVSTLLDLPSTTGVIMLNGVDHFLGSNARSIADRLAGQENLNFNWVDASTKEGSGFGLRLT
jgi:hypothetical protein